MRYFMVMLLIALGFIFCPFIECYSITGVNYAYAKTPEEEAAAAKDAKDQANMVLKLYQQFERIANSQNALFQNMAVSLFKICALIGIFMMGVHAVLSRASLEDIIKEFVMYLLFAGVCFIAIEHYDTWTKWFIDLEAKIADRINSSTTISKGNYNLGTKQFGLGPMMAGFDFLVLILRSINIDGISGAVLAVIYCLLGIIILGILAMMTARLIVVLCESLIAINLGVLLLGFGAWSSTREYAIAHFKFCGATFMKLLSMHFIIYIGLAILYTTYIRIQYESGGKELTLGLVCLTAAMVLILYIIAQSLPQTIASMINGVNTSSGIGFRAALVGTGMAAAAMTTARVVGNAPVATATAFASGVQNVRGARAVAQSEGKSLGAGRMVGSFFAGAGKSISGAVTEGVRDKRRASGSFITKTTQSMQDNTSAVGSAQKAARGDTQRMASLHRNYGNTLYQHGRGGNEYANYIAREGGGKPDPYQDNPHSPGGDNSTATGTLKTDQIEKSMAMREKELTANRPKEKNA